MQTKIALAGNLTHGIAIGIQRAGDYASRFAAAYHLR
jgi:hypothetical protein